MANPVTGLATTTQNLPAGKRAPEFPVDRERLAKATGGSVEDRYHAPLGEIKDLIRAVKAGYTKKVIDEGMQKPSTLDIFNANGHEIATELLQIMKTSKLFRQQASPLPLVNNEMNALWPHVVEILKNPAAYGCPGYEGLKHFEPIGRTSQLAAPSAPPAKK